MIKKVLLVVAVLVLGVIVLIATRPSTYLVERTTTIEAPVEVVFEQVNELHKWEQWSPWEKLDPEMTKTYEGPTSGVGAVYAWAGDEKIGEGRMTIAESVAGERISIQLQFIKPWESTNTTTFLFSTPAEGKSSVSWQTAGEMNFTAKAAALFMDMDGMLGADLESGLAELKTVSEAESKRRIEEARAREAAALAAAAAAEAEAADLEDAPPAD